VLAKVREMVLPAMTKDGPIEALDHRRHVVPEAG
jgi:hypothetical protein